MESGKANHPSSWKVRFPTYLHPLIEDRPEVNLARFSLLVYACVLPIRSTASLQAISLILSFVCLIWSQRDHWRMIWPEVRWLTGPLLIFSIGMFVLAPFWREPPLRSWDPGGWDVYQPWFSLDLWRRDIVQPMISLVAGYWAFRDLPSKKMLILVQIVLLIVLGTKAMSQIVWGEFEYAESKPIWGNPWVQGTFFMRGFSRDNIFFSYVLLLLSPGILYLYFNSKTRKEKALYGFILLILLTLVFLNKRRGTWVALFVEVLLVMSWWGWKRTTLFAFISLVAMFGAYQIRPVWFHRDYDDKKMGRIEIMERTMRLIALKPLVGVGYGKETVVKNYWTEIHQHTHNTFTNLLLSTGWPGLILWCGALGVYARRFQKKWKTDLLARVGIAFLVGFCVRNLFDDIWLSSNAEYFWLTIGIYLPDRNSISTP